MTAAQRLHWLCFGLMLAPQTYAPEVRERLRGASGSRYLDIVVALLEDGALQAQKLGVEALSLLIEAIGPHCSASWPVGGGIVSTSMRATRMVRQLVARLAAHLTPLTTTTLARLASDQELRRWKGHLQHAATLQADARREAEFKYASVEAVLATLDSRQPAADTPASRR